MFWVRFVFKCFESLVKTVNAPAIFGWAIQLSLQAGWRIQSYICLYYLFKNEVMLPAIAKVILILHLNLWFVENNRKCYLFIIRNMFSFQQFRIAYVIISFVDELVKMRISPTHHCLYYQMQITKQHSIFYLEPSPDFRIA